ncbi:unnamed protein product [Didymodactylos carnosus]|uniref:Uncharacterized protein n=1 Tax=Didymodactylos carnosus TaxID=1234261 RepID=A0A814KK21_9BILA|nr:unnamed protein product [Didymodactylos carnosus]CAF1190788.1 unnamed protein product [Didymodactylos carnosus]CAF3822372.1 unnamed protein product [Didymodactylos carnosus]CAF4001572.1 unnamed protein product [Didymodactylos carnosus]
MGKVKFSRQDALYKLASDIVKKILNGEYEIEISYKIAGYNAVRTDGTGFEAETFDMHLKNSSEKFTKQLNGEAIVRTIDSQTGVSIHSDLSSTNGNPIGTIILYTGQDLPSSKWLRCNGMKGGRQYHTMAVNELPPHSHDTGTLTIMEGGSHSHSYTDLGHNHGGRTGGAAFGAGTWGFHGSPGTGVVMADDNDLDHCRCFRSSFLAFTFLERSLHTLFLVCVDNIVTTEICRG